MNQLRDIDIILLSNINRFERRKYYQRNKKKQGWDSWSEINAHPKIEKWQPYINLNKKK